MSKDPKQGLELHVKLAGVTAVWGSLAVLTWFFPLIGFFAFILATLISASHFITAYQIFVQYNTTEEDTHDSSVIYDQPTIPGIEGTSNIGDVARGGATMGAKREGSLRENLSEGKV